MVQEAFENAGFVNYKEIKSQEPLIGLRYYDSSFPLSESNRKTISFYADADKHMDQYLSTLKSMIEDGSMPKFLLDREKIKQEFGHTTFIVAEKE